jgi:hypothetical protein
MIMIGIKLVVNEVVNEEELTNALIKEEELTNAVLEDIRKCKK